MSPAVLPRLSQFLIDASANVAGHGMKRLGSGFAADGLAVERKLKGERAVSVFLPGRDPDVLVSVNTPTRISSSKFSIGGPLNDRAI